MSLSSTSILTKVNTLKYNYVIQSSISSEVIENYNKSGTRLRHAQVIREYLNIKPYGSDARHLIVRAIGAAAKTKDEPSDLINVAIEELVRQHYELPAFSTLIRASNRIRGRANISDKTHSKT